MSPLTPAPTTCALTSFLYFYASTSVGLVARHMRVASLANILTVIKRELRRAGKAMTSETSRRCLIYITDSEELRSLGVSGVARARAIVTLEVLNIVVAFLLGPVCSFLVSLRISLVFVVLYLVVTTHRVGSILPSGDRDKRALCFDDCAIVVRRSETGENDLSVEFKTPNGKTDASRDPPVILRCDMVHPLFCPLLWFFVLAHRADAMSHWPYTVLELLSPTVFEQAATDDKLTFSFKGGAVCAATRPITGQRAAECLREVSNCLRLRVSIRPHNLRLSGALKLKWLGKSQAWKVADFAGQTVDEIRAQLRHVWRSTTWMVYTGTTS